MLLLVLIALLSFGAVRAIVGPVGRLQGFARELGARRFGARLPESGPPETAELAEAFNATAESLQRATERHLAELDAVFRDAPLGLAFLDRDLRFLRVNEALAHMNQVPAAEHLGPHRRRGHRPTTTSRSRCAAWSSPASRCSTASSRSTAASSTPATSRCVTTAASCWPSARR